MKAHNLPNWLVQVELSADRFQTIPQAMRAANRWLLHRKKQPFYVDGLPRSGSLDSPEDTLRLGTFEAANAALSTGDWDGLGFALGAGWQGIDLDKVEANGLTELANNLPGYVERSPSGKGLHAIGHGRRFKSLGANASGTEAYCGKRYFTVTGEHVRGEITDIADFVEEKIAPLHGVNGDLKAINVVQRTGTPFAEGGRNNALTSLAGTMRSRGLSPQAIDAALQIENLARCKPPLPEDEVRRIAQSVGRYAVANDASLEDTSGIFSAVGEQIDWPEPLPIPGLPEVPPFELTMLPVSLRPWIADVADRLQVPADMPAMAAITAVSSVLGRRVQIRPKEHDHWTVTPNLWGMVIAPPGCKKSPAISAAMAPLHKLERLASHEHEAAMQNWLIEKERVNIANSAAKSVAQKNLQKDPAFVIPDLTPEPTEPTPRRHVVNNFSLEALGEVQISNPWGILAFGDELYGLLKMTDKPGNEELNSFLLTAWNGDDGFTFDRIGRGRRYVEYVCISIFGGIQPGRLQDYLTFGGSGGAIDSGFLNRFQLMAWPDLPESYRYIDRVPDRVAEETYQRVFDRIAGVNQFPNLTDDAPSKTTTDVRHFDIQAQAVFQEWLEANERLCRSDTLPPVLTSHLSKYASMVPSLALIFAVADDVKGAIPVQYVNQALDWAKYLRGHAERVFACTTNPDNIHARALLEKIKEGVVPDGFNTRDVYHKGWSLLHREGVEKAVALLCDLDHLMMVKQSPTGKGRPPGAVYRINPRCIAR